MYRRTSKYQCECEKLAQWRDAKKAKRSEGPPPDYPVALPKLRMRITIERFDFDKEKHVIEMHKTNRIDLYDITIDDELWKQGIGLSRVLEWIRKALPRIRSIRAG